MSSTQDARPLSSEPLVQLASDPQPLIRRSGMRLKDSRFQKSPSISGETETFPDLNPFLNDRAYPAYPNSWKGRSSRTSTVNYTKAEENAKESRARSPSPGIGRLVKRLTLNNKNADADSKKSSKRQNSQNSQSEGNNSHGKSENENLPVVSGRQRTMSPSKLSVHRESPAIDDIQPEQDQAYHGASGPDATKQRNEGSAGSTDKSPASKGPLKTANGESKSSNNEPVIEEKDSSNNKTDGEPQKDPEASQVGGKSDPLRQNTSRDETTGL